MPQLAVLNGVAHQISSQLDIKKLSTFSNVAAGTTSSMQLPLTATYHRIWLRFRTAGLALLTDAQIATALTKVRVIIDGDPVWNSSGADLQMLLSHWMGTVGGVGACPLTANSGSLLLPFSRSWMNGLIDQEEAGAIGTLDRKSVAIEFDQAGGGVAAFCDLYAEVGPNEALGRYIALRNYTINGVASGDLQIFNTFPQDGNKSLLGVHLQTNLVTQITVRPDGVTPMWDQLPISVLQSMMEAYRLQWQGGAATPWINVPFVRRYRNTDAYNLGDKGFMLIPTFSANPGAVRVIAEISETK